MKYVALGGEQIFLLDAEDVSNEAYGYSMTRESCGNRMKTGSSSASWLLRSAFSNNAVSVGLVIRNGKVSYFNVINDGTGVSPALNVNLTSVIFSSVVSETNTNGGTSYKLTLLDDAMTIAPGSGVTKSGNTVTIPYSISGDNSGNASQVSVLVLDKEYTAGNTNEATILDYQKLNVDSFSTSGTGTYTLPDSLSGKKAGTDYHVYILAEDVNGEKETDYASEPVEIYLWEAPTVKTINFGTENIIDPARPNNTGDAWEGCYVYYGSYDTDGDETAEPVKYRVLDASTTDYSADGTTKTMLLDCDSILYYQQFDEDKVANVDGKNANDWSISDVKASLNGEDFLNKDGVFTTVEKTAIAQSTKASHALTTNSETGVNVTSSTKDIFENYVALGGEQIFLLDAEDVSNGAYGYSKANKSCGNRKKTGSSAASWWLRSANYSSDYYAGCVYSDGDFISSIVSGNGPGVSPAFNLNLTSVIFSSGSAVSKSSALTRECVQIGTTTGTEWKLTLKDSNKSVTLTEGRSVTKASDGTITVPYTYKDSASADAEKVNQISVMITDKAYDATKDANAQEAQILYYGSLDNIEDLDGNDTTVAKSSTGIGTFELPTALADKTQGTDYHIYLLAEHVSEGNNTDYASQPLEIEVKTPIDTTEVEVPSIDAPIAELPFATEVNVSGTNVSSKATITWSKDGKAVSGNAELNTTYEASVTLTAEDGYALVDAFGSITSVTLNGRAVDSSDITVNANGTLTIYLGEYTSVMRKVAEVTAPAVPAAFTDYYTAEDVLSATELTVPAKVTLEGTTKPNPVDMEVEWTLANAENAPYDATPGAENTFKWVVKESAYANYDKNGVTLEGTVTIRNKELLAAGTTEADDTGTANYKITVSDMTNGTVTYVAPTDAKATKVTIPETATIGGVTYKITAIEKNAFKNCKKLKTVKLGKNIITIGDKAFYKCTALTKITIPDKVKTIGKQAFYGCKNLKAVTIGKNVSKIGSKAFYSCKKLKTLTIKSKKLTTKKIGSKAFFKTPKSMTVKVPKKKLKTYKSMLIKRGVNKKAKFKKF